ncbi:Structure-specific endonuclease subunit SLX4 [Bagarius yarrelli]|uniref:Structure-specific endonuclease subunit SLX4 n=1 Tax=Bagarius yarrelli TaxID=175774 RepID=A0A556TTX4_BAGYA|nr:Structure-specific endonuclease subunit SLX4 [Bagarius yarrelli]
MRRTQLFPSSHSSSSSSVSDNLQSTSCSNSFTDISQKLSQPTPGFQKLPYLSRFSKTSHSDSVDRTNPNSEFCSSTPLHSDPPQRHLDTLGSPLLGDGELRAHSRASQEGKLESSHLSPSENSLSPRRGCRSEKESSSLKSQHTNPGDSEDQEMGAEQQEAVETRTSKTNEVMEDGFSFVFDEPPIAFDDSWGLGEAVGQQGPQFSLRLESSGDQNSPPEQSVQGETASLQTFSSPSGARGNLPEPEAPLNHSLPDAAMWDSWKEDDVDEERADTPPLSQRVGSVALAKRVAELRTPEDDDSGSTGAHHTHARYGVRPLPKKQMVLKLKEIHQYTHQLMSSSSEEETSPKNRPRVAPAAFKQPTAPPPVSPRKLQFEQEEEQEDALPASQDSNTSSTAESERSNPEMCDSDDDVSDSEGITASQAVVREKDKLQAVRAFILSDPVLYGRVLQYQPLVLSELKAALRVAGVRLGTAKLLDFLDSQCITFTTAKQGHPAPSRRRARGAGRGRKKTAKSGD